MHESWKLYPIGHPVRNKIEAELWRKHVSGEEQHYWKKLWWSEFWAEIKRQLFGGDHYHD